jgi:hypothetical protein
MNATFICYYRSPTFQLHRTYKRFISYIMKQAIGRTIGQ